MRKGTLEATLSTFIWVVLAFVALIVVWSVLEKVFGFSIGLLLGTALKEGYCNLTGGNAGTGALVGGGAAAGLCAAGIALGWVSLGTTALIGCGLGVAIGSGMGAATTANMC